MHLGQRCNRAVSNPRFFGLVRHPGRRPEMYCSDRGSGATLRPAGCMARPTKCASSSAAVQATTCTSGGSATSARGAGRGPGACVHSAAAH